MDVTERLDALEREVRVLRDKEAIRDLLSTYAFNADVGRIDEYLDGWTNDGVYDVMEDMQLRGREAIAGLLTPPDGFHKQQLENRSQHLVANLFIAVAGDTAWAEGYSIVTIAADGAFRIFSAAYNRWEFARADSGWKMGLRQRRVVGGPTWGGDVITRYLG